MKKKVLAIVLSAAMIMGMSTVLTGCGSSGGKNGEVHVYTFGDYIDPDLVGEFEDQTGIKVVLDTFDTNEEMYPVIKNNSAQYDVVCMSDYMVEKMIGEKLLAELDYNNIPNIKNIDKSYLKIAESYDPGNKYAVPHTWGTMGIIYNTKKIPEGSITSWNDLWNKKYSGQIVMPDSMRDTMAIALKAKGYSLNSTDEKQIKEATQYLIAQKPLVYKYANDSARDLILGGSCDIAVIWSGEVYYCKKTNTDLAYVVPKEGSEEFEDSWVVTKTAKNKENAEKWINFMCDKKTAMKNFDYLTYSIPNVSVIDKVKNEKDQAMMDVLFPKEAVLKNCEALKSLGAENDDMYTKYWNQFKGE